MMSARGAENDGHKTDEPCNLQSVKL